MLLAVPKVSRHDPQELIDLRVGIDALYVKFCLEDHP